jgi:MFS family permease
MLAQGGVYQRLAGKKTELWLMTAGVTMMFLGLGGIAAVARAAEPDSAGNLRWVFFLTIAVAVSGFAFVNPSVSSLVSKRADPARQGEVQGVSQSFASLGRILGPFIGSVLFQVDPTRVLPYATAGVTLAVVVLLLPFIRRTEGTRMG